MSTTQAPAPPARQLTPIFGGTYGPSGLGKSSDLLLSFPRAFFIGAKGGITHLASSLAGIPVYCDMIVGPQIGQPPAASLQTASAWAQWAASQGFEILCFDDLSMLADKTYREADAVAPIGKNGKPDGFYGYVTATDALFWLKDFCRYTLNVHAFFNAHETPAWVDKDSQTRVTGRPDFPGNQAPIHFPPTLDFVYRAHIPPSAMMAAQGAGADSLVLDWPAVYRNNPVDPDWFSKCRFGMPDLMPMNLGEIFRSEGYVFARAQGLEWMEDAVEAVARYIVGGAKDDDVLGWAYAQVDLALAGGKFDAFKVKRWLRRDAKARVQIRRARAKRLDSLKGGAWRPPAQVRA